MAAPNPSSCNPPPQSERLEDQEPNAVVNPPGEPFNYDDILDHVGQLGRYQLRIFLLLCLPISFPSVIIMSYSFIGGVPNYRCYVDGCDESGNQTHEFVPLWLNNTIPWGKVDDKALSRCYRYNHSWTDLDHCLLGDGTANLGLERCNRWVYDTSVFQSTVFTEFQLTCENDWLQSVPSVVYMVGMLIGAIVLGTVADRIGRKLAFVFNVAALAVVGIGTAFAPDIVTFSALRFFSGMGSIGQFDVVYVWGVESVGPKYRVLCGFFYQTMFTLGSILVGIGGYFIRDWRILQLVIAVPLFALIGLFWIVPESTLWLISKKRFEEARVLILKASQMNNKPVPEYLVELPRSSLKVDPEEKMDRPNPNESKQENLLDVFRSRTLMKRLLITSAAWIAVNMGFYGITYSASNLSGDFYLNYQLFMIVEIPAYAIARYLVEHVGRRSTLSSCLIIGGFSCLVTGLMPEDPAYIRISFCLFGKFFITAVFGVIYTFTVELFPTSTRTATVGVCSTAARIGGILAPILADAGRRSSQPLPFTIFAFVNIAVGILCLMLPETSGLSLPVNVAQAVDLEKHTLSWLSCFRQKKTTSISVISTSGECARKPSV